MKVRRLLKEEHEERLRKGYCPRCKTYSLINVEITKFVDLPPVKHKLIQSYWKCNGPHGFLCYFISSEKGPVIFESANGTKPVEFSEQKEDNKISTIIRRKKKVE